MCRPRAFPRGCAAARSPAGAALRVEDARGGHASAPAPCAGKAACAPAGGVRFMAAVAGPRSRPLSLRPAAPHGPAHVARSPRDSVPPLRRARDAGRRRPQDREAHGEAGPPPRPRRRLPRPPAPDRPPPPPQPDRRPRRRGRHRPHPHRPAPPPFPGLPRGGGGRGPRLLPRLLPRQGGLAPQAPPRGRDAHRLRQGRDLGGRSPDAPPRPRPHRGGGAGAAGLRIRLPHHRGPRPTPAGESRRLGADGRPRPARVDRALPQVRPQMARLARRAGPAAPALRPVRPLPPRPRPRAPRL